MSKVGLNCRLKLNFINKLKHICTYSTTDLDDTSHGDCFVTIIYAREIFWVTNSRWIATMDEKRSNELKGAGELSKRC